MDIEYPPDTSIYIVKIDSVIDAFLAHDIER